MQTVWVKHCREIPEELWKRCFIPPVEGLWMYEALEKSNPHQQFEYFYGLILNNGNPVGIAPAFVYDVPLDLVAPPWIANLLQSTVGRFLSWVRYQRTLFLGSPCTDEGTVGLLPGIDMHAAVQCVHEALQVLGRQKQVSMIVWKDVPEASAPIMDVLLSKHRIFKIPSYPGTHLDAPGDSFSAYLTRLNAKRRYNLAKKLRKGRQAGSYQVSVLHEPDEKTIDELFGLFSQTYQRSDTKFEKLTPHFFHHVALHEGSDFIILRDQSTSKAAAFMLCFRIGERIINKFVGFDYALGDERYLYFLLWEAFVDWACTHQPAELRSGQTAYGAKIDLGHKLVPLYNYCHHRNPLMHKIFKAISKTITWETLDEDLEIYLKAHTSAIWHDKRNF
jgi:predicted N-acyltransferase